MRREQRQLAIRERDRTLVGRDDVAAGLEREPDVIQRRLGRGDVERRRLDEHAKGCRALRESSDDIATVGDARLLRGAPRVRQRAARLDDERGGRRIESRLVVDRSMTLRCDAGDAAGKIEVALEEIAPLVEEPGEPAANVAESDEAEVDAHQAAVYRGSIDHEDVGDSDKDTRAAR